MKLIVDAVANTVIEENATMIMNQKYDAETGITDIEVTDNINVHIIFEAKRGWILPGAEQLTKYSLRQDFVNSKAKAKHIVTLSECTADYANAYLPFREVNGVPVTHLPWHRVYELDEGTKEILNAKLQMAVDFADSEPEITITHFVADKKKAGGAYVKHTGVIKKVDEYEHTVIFTDKTVICIENIFAIDGELYNCLE